MSVVLFTKWEVPLLALDLGLAKSQRLKQNYLNENTFTTVDLVILAEINDSMCSQLVVLVAGSVESSSIQCSSCAQGTDRREEQGVAGAQFCPRVQGKLAAMVGMLLKELLFGIGLSH